MSHTVYKIILRVTDRQVVVLPKSAKLLHVHEQRGEICVWYLKSIDDDDELEDRTVHIIGTGHIFGDVDRITYLGTAHLQDGELVFHVFVEEKKL